MKGVRLGNKLRTPASQGLGKQEEGALLCPLLLFQEGMDPMASFTCLCSRG